MGEDMLGPSFTVLLTPGQVAQGGASVRWTPDSVGGSASMLRVHVRIVWVYCM